MRWGIRDYVITYKISLRQAAASTEQSNYHRYGIPGEHGLMKL